MAKNKKKRSGKQHFDNRDKVIAKIREQANPFDLKFNRQKVDIVNTKNLKGNPGISKQKAENERKLAYQLKKSRKNKIGGLVDRRFGENDSNLSSEEKMLERFTREKQSSSKKSLYDIDNDDNDGTFDFDNDSLTHYGQTLSLKDDFDEGDLGIPKSNDSDLNNENESFGIKKHQLDENLEQPVRKKTKAEVMKEIVAKSKFYKHERQKLQEKRLETVEDLDDQFDEIMNALGTVEMKKNINNNSNKNNKTEKDVEYDQVYKNLLFDRRSVPADRTKTEEEINKETQAKKKKLEDDRLRRMEAMNAQGVEDLDDFWAGSDIEEQNEINGFVVKNSSDAEENNDLDIFESELDLNSNLILKPKKKSAALTFSCPEDHEQLLLTLSSKSLREHPDIIKKIIKNTDAKFAAENKEKLSNFAVILLDHILYLANSNYSTDEYETYCKVQENLINSLRLLANKFQEAVCEKFRSIIDEVQERIVNTITKEANEYPKVSDLVFFTIIGVVYSTSDHYHLVVTPALIIIAEALEQFKIKSLNDIFSGLFMVDLNIKYQRMSKRYMPEATLFLQKSLLSLTPSMKGIDPKSISASIPVNFLVTTEFGSCKKKLKISDLKNKLDPSYGPALLLKTIKLIDKSCDIWREKSAFIEIVEPFLPILKHLLKNYPSVCDISKLIEKINNLKKFALVDHKPLVLQSHRPIGVATYAPKFEENYNPDKKSYDPNRDRQEIKKLNAQIKKEKKLALREIRRDTKTISREQIKEKKDKYSEYHSKMARLVNEINTVEGSERNKYNKERKSRKGH
ncbi:snoRNA-binding rRNA-processing protein NOP14 [Ascoidea rubescens DSM 1968]|uniref:Nop14-like protein n=1 Tax=Ascoidea rubescens DSM 1968 TaxID=1344418 RepID=A0A1D2VBB9_9ASCO|nr:Nop14-like protein [Ascoidea rubescens DSM 1968]ODV58763.1 Nop14-like protein [Ascoidea rubescens DSM 1968]